LVVAEAVVEAVAEVVAEEEVVVVVGVVSNL